jgi:dTDP-glucose 4,6-dehydratase
MAILVTGSQGTLGRPLVAALRTRGHDVWGLDLSHQGDPQYIRANLSSYRQLERAFDAAPFETVYHLAAEFGRLNGEEYYDTLWESNAAAAQTVQADLCQLLGNLRRQTWGGA